MSDQENEDFKKLIMGAFAPGATSFPLILPNREDISEQSIGPERTKNIIAIYEGSHENQCVMQFSGDPENTNVWPPIPEKMVVVALSVEETVERLQRRHPSLNLSIFNDFQTGKPTAVSSDFVTNIDQVPLDQAVSDMLSGSDPFSIHTPVVVELHRNRQKDIQDGKDHGIIQVLVSENIGTVQRILGAKPNSGGGPTEPNPE